MATDSLTLTKVQSESGDWEVLYINGEEVAQGHSLSVRQVLDALKQRGVLSFSCFEVADKNIEELGWSFPAKLDEIPEEFLNEY